MPQLYDMHCHLDFANAPTEVAEGSNDGMFAISSSVVPSSYVSARERFAEFANVHVALGIHPWWVANDKVGEVDVARFEGLLVDERVVGEVGLDFHGRNRDSKARQVDVLGRVLSAIESEGADRLVFLHAVKGCQDVLDMMEDAGTHKGNACVFHWFSGSRDDFGRAVSLGCMFSVNMRMLATPAGLEFAKAIPEDKLLMETDSPSREGTEWSAAAWRQEAENTVRGIAEARGAGYERTLEVLATNSKALVSRYCA